MDGNLDFFLTPYTLTDTIHAVENLNNWIFPGSVDLPVGGFTLEILNDDDI